MEYIPLSLVAGILTIFSPCVLPVLPTIIGGSLTGQNWKRPVVITAALALSLVLFGILLKSSTLLIDVPQYVWSTFSGSIILVFGLFTLFPDIWEEISLKLKLSNSSSSLLQKAGQNEGLLGAALIGFALGPVFSSCSPTYALVIATVLPESFAVGLLNLLAYALGLASTLLIIAIFGQNLIARTKWAANPHGKFRKILGVMFIILGIAIILGFDKDIETYLIKNGYLGSTDIEYKLVENRL